jgi:DNA-binding NtrC family response regulator
MTKLQRLVSKASRSSSPALIIGESGTGKAELASSIHFGSPRRGSPFVVYNASTDSAQQIEIDLFGSDGGVSTTLRSNMRGKIEAAAKGTLFINEIENLPASVQWKLIEVLDTWTFSRFGCEVKRRLDLHLVFGTSENLPGDPDSSGLNAELLSRISAFTLRIPALRDRSEDIPILCEHYITQICIANCRRRPEISADAMNLLVAYQWPGNLVELKSALEHAVALADNDMIDARDLPETIARLDQTGIDYNPASRNIGGRTINELERLSLMEALESCNGNRRKVAERLGVSLRTVYNLMDRYGISRDRRPSQEEAGNVS